MDGFAIRKSMEGKEEKNNNLIPHPSKISDAICKKMADDKTKPKIKSKNQIQRKPQPHLFAL